MTPLFQTGRFTLHSGATSLWKIECDALTDDDWTTLAILIRQQVGAFSAVEGVPRGGLALAAKLRRFACKRPCPLLIVDDVWTTGGSMEAHRAGRDAIGAVVFARRPVAPWVTPLFAMPAARLTTDTPRFSEASPHRTAGRR